MRRNVIMLVGRGRDRLGRSLATLASGNRRCSASTCRAASRWCCPRWATYKSDSLDVAVDIIRNRVDGFGVARARDHPPGRRHRRRPPRGEGPRQGARASSGKTAELRFRPVLAVAAARGREHQHHDDDAHRLDHHGRDGPATPTTTTTPPSDEAAAAARRVVRRGHGGRPRPRSPPRGVADDERDDCVVLPDSRAARRPALLPRPDRAHRQGRRQRDESSSARARATWSSIDLNGDGSAKFNELAAQQFSQPSPSGDPNGHGAIAIILDGIVQSAPEVQEPDLRGHGRRSPAAPGDFDEERRRGPRQADRLRRAAGPARRSERRERVADARAGPARCRHRRRRHRPRARRHLHARLLPPARAGGDHRAHPQRDGAVHARHVPRADRLRPHAHPGRRHRHHRVGRGHRRLVHRLLRTAEGRGARRRDRALVRRPCVHIARSARSSPPTSCRSSAPRCSTSSPSVAYGASRFFLGLSTVLDLVLSYFFMHPLVVAPGAQPGARAR